MKLENPLPGEEEELQKKLRKAQRKYRQIPPEEEEKIAKQVHNKIERREKVRKTFRRILAALGLSMAIGGSAATIATISDHNKQIEQEEETNSAKKRQEFAQQYQQEIEDVDEERNYSREINRIKTEEELLNYLKELYIEERKEIMGDTLLKPDNIKIMSGYTNFLYQDQKTGKLITHGDYPKNTEQKLADNGIEYGVIDDTLKIYRVEERLL